MRIRLHLRAGITFGLACFLAASTRGQIAISAGPYSHSFNSLATSGTSNPWTDNVTLPGWYASKTSGGTAVTSYPAGTGSANAGALYSFGGTGVGNLTDRALGSIASGTPGSFAYGIRFTNDTAFAQTNIQISYLGEQWRNGGSGTQNTLTSSYRVSTSAITNSDASNADTWTALPALDFVTPTLVSITAALDGNDADNQQVFASILLIGVTVAAGEELFLRWRDVDDVGSDHGLAIDDLTVVFSNASNQPSAPVIQTQPASQTVTVAENVAFTVLATGNPAPIYQWQFNGSNLTGETGSTLRLDAVTTNHSGYYQVVITNSAGATNSAVATLTVLPAESADTLSILTYNVKGNGAEDWSTNSPQIQAIARQLQYLRPDVITFNEIPYDLRHEMTNFLRVFLPDYKLAVSSGTDGSICSAIASRYSITRSSSWMPRMDLRGFGYSNINDNLDNFTRDLFEAEIAVPRFPQPVHIFTTHLKATASAAEYDDNAAKRAAEATAITNFLATNLFIPHPFRPCVLTGDMNAADTNELSIQKLVSLDGELSLTDPKNPVTGSLNTYSTTTANPASRLDYIFPSQFLFSNIRTSLVFRTDRLAPLPPNLNSNDCKVASDHFPVLLVFNNPYDKPFKLLSITRTNPNVTLRWESVPGQPYRVEAATNLAAWGTLAGNLVATGTNQTFSTNLSPDQQFFRVQRIP